jgi:uncharacterized membrane protein
MLLVIMLTSCATHKVSYQHDIAPVLESRCVKCHSSPDGSGYRATGLELDSYDGVIKGTIYGPIVIAGDSRRSILNMMVEGRAGRRECMPEQSQQSLSDEQIGLLNDWVKQGAMKN